MKYSIHGFQQESAHLLGLDNNDLLILRWLVDFSATGKMSFIEDGKSIYYWISYNALCNDLPILNMKKDTVYRRLKKLCNTNVLKSKTIKKGGTFSYYAFGSNYEQLIHSDLNPRGYGFKSEGGRIKIRTKDPSISNHSIKESAKVAQLTNFTERPEGYQNIEKFYSNVKKE